MDRQPYRSVTCKIDLWPLQRRHINRVLYCAICQHIQGETVHHRHHVFVDASQLHHKYTASIPAVPFSRIVNETRQFYNSTLSYLTTNYHDRVNCNVDAYLTLLSHRHHQRLKSALTSFLVCFIPSYAPLNGPDLLL